MIGSETPEAERRPAASPPVAAEASEPPVVVPQRPADGSTGGPPRPLLRAARGFARQWLGTIVLGALIWLALQLTVQNYQVQGESMLPTVQDGDRVLIDRLAYRIGSPSRGDVVVFRFPYASDEQDYIKRIIGLPGDTVEVRSGTVLVNGGALAEPYIRFAAPYSYGPQRVPGGKYFVLGDNRPVSYDSHSWGFVARSALYGRVMLTWWPPRSFHAFGF